jgi:hypothetical protein
LFQCFHFGPRKSAALGVLPTSPALFTFQNWAAPVTNFYFLSS